jgi:hypothetical protein
MYKPNLILHDFQIYDKIDDRTPCQKLAVNKAGEILAAYYKPHPFAGPPYWSIIKQGETFAEIDRPRLEENEKESEYYAKVLKVERNNGAPKERINFLISLIEFSLKWENKKEEKRTNKLTKIFNY